MFWSFGPDLVRTLATPPHCRPQIGGPVHPFSGASRVGRCFYPPPVCSSTPAVVVWCGPTSVAACMSSLTDVKARLSSVTAVGWGGCSFPRRKNGVALIRFVPSCERNLVRKMFRFDVVAVPSGTPLLPLCGSTLVVRHRADVHVAWFFCCRIGLRLCRWYETRA